MGSCFLHDHSIPEIVAQAKAVGRLSAASSAVEYEPMMRRRDEASVEVTAFLEDKRDGGQDDGDDAEWVVAEVVEVESVDGVIRYPATPVTTTKAPTTMSSTTTTTKAPSTSIIRAAPTTTTTTEAPHEPEQVPAYYSW